MSKNFRTVDELVEILESREIAVDGGAHEAIERESYYAIVNGYKNPFLNKRAMMRSHDDVYYPGTRFQWIYDLFLFDRDLRIITFRYLTRAEAIMRTAVAYSFCHNHPEKDAYTDRSNFCPASDYLVPAAFKGNKRKLHTKNLSDLISRLNDKLVVKPKSRDFIKHYMKTYGTVPLWVLANDLTFGNIVHFYQLMKVKDRREVCKIVSDVTNRDVEKRKHLRERDLLRAASVLNDFRCLCAHDERLYCARFDNDDFRTMTTLMPELLPVDEARDFVNEVLSLIAAYSSRLHRVNPYSLLRDMGFDVGPAPKARRKNQALSPKPHARKSAHRTLCMRREIIRQRRLLQVSAKS